MKFSDDFLGVQEQKKKRGIPQISLYVDLPLERGVEMKKMSHTSVVARRLILR